MNTKAYNADEWWEKASHLYQLAKINMNFAQIHKEDSF